MEIQEALNNLVITILIGVVGVVGVYLRLALKKLTTKTELQISKIEDEKQRQLLLNVKEDVRELVENTIITTEQTTVKGLKAQNEDGKLTVNDGKVVLSQVKESVLNQLSNDSKELMIKNTNNLEEYLNNLIESTLAEIQGKI
ncbi:hypothetical protein [uncultured Clostridium sp.]|uniref:hypothetical protein n=1 Tax=uncultured Clostridium sp. TaxID=59620 RepID=UPI0032166BF1